MDSSRGFQSGRLASIFLCFCSVALVGVALPAAGTTRNVDIGVQRSVRVVQNAARSTGFSEKLSGTNVTILYAPSEDDDAAFRSDISAITGAPVDYWDAVTSTPTLADLQEYGCVFTWADSSYADQVAMGDVLADYVDAGGVVVLGAFVTFTQGNFLAGRIMTAGYAPVTSPTGGNLFTTLNYNGDGTTLIWDQVTVYSTDYPDDVVLQGTGIADGTLGSGVLGAAYRPDFRVVLVNGAGDSDVSGAGTAQLIANACSVGAVMKDRGIPALDGGGILLLIAGLALAAVVLLRFWR